MVEEPTLTIGALAQASGVHLETIRYYQRLGLVPQPARPAGSVRRYDARAVARLRFIRRAQQLGFSLDEVGQLLALDDGGSSPRTEARSDRPNRRLPPRT